MSHFNPWCRCLKSGFATVSPGQKRPARKRNFIFWIELARGFTRLRHGSGRSVVRLARLLGVQEVGSSNLPAPTIFQGKSDNYCIFYAFIQQSSGSNLLFHDDGCGAGGDLQCARCRLGIRMNGDCDGFFSQRRSAGKLRRCSHQVRKDSPVRAGGWCRQEATSNSCPDSNSNCLARHPTCIGVATFI